MIEREILIKLNCDYLVKLHSTFQDKFKLYFVMEYCQGGEFSRFLRKHKKLSDSALKFYLAELVLIIEFLHSQGIVHRDLKVSIIKYL
jgi:serine/threonine protein kinase